MSDQCEALCEIKDFTEFLEKCLDRKVLEYTLKPLTKPGDNYGSVMQSVEVKIAGSSDPKEVNIECYSNVIQEIMQNIILIDYN